MSMVPDAETTNYEDLLSLWGDLESSLGMLLAVPENVEHFAQKIRQYDRWLQDLLSEDGDTGLYLLFQMAGTSIAGYSTTHSLICAALCHVIALELKLPPVQRDSLVAAAMTMNIAMTALQDELAEQPERPSIEQQSHITEHSAKSCMLLARVGIHDELWLGIVASHHETLPLPSPGQPTDPTTRLAHVLQIIDRYAAMISPRRSRPGRSVTDSLRMVIAMGKGHIDDVAQSLVRYVGLCPPGTYVRLENQDLAVVLRRTPQPNQPLVASLVNARGEPYHQPRLYHTGVAGPRIQAAVPSNAISLMINHAVMLEVARLHQPGQETRV
ncbi:MAG: phosphodiesterase [Curvibacter sp.]|nr:phosphodiesterase [Curvibacter sp.]